MKAVGGWKGIAAHGRGTTNSVNTYGPETLADDTGSIYSFIILICLLIEELFMYM
jgi:hypothetical protein